MVGHGHHHRVTMEWAQNDRAIFLDSEASQPQLSTSDTTEFEAFWEMKYNLWQEGGFLTLH